MRVRPLASETRVHCHTTLPGRLRAVHVHAHTERVRLQRLRLEQMRRIGGALREVVMADLGEAKSLMSIVAPQLTAFVDTELCHAHDKHGPSQSCTRSRNQCRTPSPTQHRPSNYTQGEGCDRWDTDTDSDDE